MKKLLIIALIALAVIGLSNLVTPVRSTPMKVSNIHTDKVLKYSYDELVACAWFVEQVR
jgi:hypothetical protein